MKPQNIRRGALVLASLVAVSSAAQASVLISSGPTSNMNCQGNVCQATAKKAVLNATALAQMLATKDVTIDTGAGAVTITVVQSFSWTSTHTLSLEASDTVSFQAPITVAGPGGLVIDYAKGGAGDLVFFPGASVSFWDMSSTFSLQGQTFTLEPSLDKLASDIAAANGAGNFALANDFDQTGHVYTAAPLSAPRGNLALEGAGHAIANLAVHAPQGVDCVGLFDMIFGSVDDLIFTGADISSGTVSNTGIVNGCGNAALAHVSTGGNVSVGKTSFAGGLSGVSGSIRDSSSSANVTAPSADHLSYIGGLVGVHAGTITNSSASGNVTGGDNVVAGGLVGTSHGIIKFSHASGNVSVGNESRRHEGVGGLAGISGGGGQVTQSFATGHVSGGSGAYVGGLVGYGGNVDNSYATGSAQCTGSCFAGGLIGGSFRGLGIGLSYSTASVGGGQIGGFVGDTHKKALFDTYWDLDTSGVSDPSQGAGNIANAAGVTGLSNTELKSALPAGFDPAIWAQKRKINKSYPYLIANPPQ